MNAVRVHILIVHHIMERTLRRGYRECKRSEGKVESLFERSEFDSTRSEFYILSASKLKSLE